MHGSVHQLRTILNAPAKLVCCSGVICEWWCVRACAMHVLDVFLVRCTAV